MTDEQAEVQIERSNTFFKNEKTSYTDLTKLLNQLGTLLRNKK
jgi:hypothetical protein